MRLRIQHSSAAGESDEIIPPKMMHSLRDASTSARVCEFASIPKGFHNDTWTRPEYYSHFAKFMEQIAKSHQDAGGSAEQEREQAREAS